jgi:hypothetical protein
MSRKRRYYRRDWDYGSLSLAAAPTSKARLPSADPTSRSCRILCGHHGVLARRLRGRMSRTRPGVHEASATLAHYCCCVLDSAMTQQPAEYDRGLLMVESASGALDDAGLEHTGSSAVGPSTCGSVGSLVHTTILTYWSGDGTRPVSTRRSRQPADSTRRLLRTCSAPATPATASSSSSPLWCPAQKERSSFRSRGSR